MLQPIIRLQTSYSNINNGDDPSHSAHQLVKVKLKAIFDFVAWRAFVFKEMHPSSKAKGSNLIHSLIYKYFNL